MLSPFSGVGGVLWVTLGMFLNVSHGLGGESLVLGGVPPSGFLFFSWWFFSLVWVEIVPSLPHHRHLIHGPWLLASLLLAS